MPSGGVVPRAAPMEPPLEETEALSAAASREVPELGKDMRAFICLPVKLSLSLSLLSLSLLSLSALSRW